HRHPGHAECDQATANKDHRREVDAVGKLFQPAAHRYPRERPGNDVADEHQFAEVIGEQHDDAPHAAAQHLAHTDFLGTAFGVEYRKTIEAETGDADGQQRRDVEQRQLTPVGLQRFLHTLIEETAPD